MRKLVELNGNKRVRPAKGKTGESMKHESAEKQVTGKAIYIDDA
jgi:xanthine dehydrogenase large subunit